MKNNTLLNSKKKILLYSISIFCVLSIIYLSLAVLLQIHTNQLKKSEIIKNEEKLVSFEQKIISYRIDRVVSDVLYIADNFRAHSLDYDFSNIEKDWKSFSDRKKIYDQIRYIDLDGNEKIRINYYDNGSIVIGKEQLQNKKDRYYFQDTIGLKKNQIYISKLDLNIENEKIEQPIKPMIRFSTPIFGYDGNLKGIVILNYYAQNILQQFENTATTSDGNMYLLDPKSYWVYNSEDKSKEWAFMYDDKKNINFKNEYPFEWDIISKNDKGTFNTLNGYYSYTNIINNSEEVSSNSLILGDGNLIAVSYIPKSSEEKLIIFTDLYSNIKSILINHKLIFIFILILSIIFAFLITINKLEKERIKYFSEYDTMTGALNRRAGFEILNKMYTDYTKKNNNISVCFCDINGLKEVNDNLGHEAGDELILTIVNIIKKNINSSDLLIRLGGDEFLIIFVNSNVGKSENIWNDICNEFMKINEVDNRDYIISVSHGIEEFKFKGNEYIDEVINLADAKMYNEKRIIKKDLQIIRKKYN